MNNPDSNTNAAANTEANEKTHQQTTDPASSDAETQITKQIADLEAQVKEKENKFLYLYADFENFKKRSIKERSDLIKFGWESVARELLLVFDNINRALQHVPEGTDKSFLNGLVNIQKQFQTTLEKQGVQPIETTNQLFDPTLHEAVGQAPSPQPSGTVIHEETKGYTLHGRLLRPSRVIISQGS